MFRLRSKNLFAISGLVLSGCATISAERMPANGPAAPDRLLCEEIADVRAKRICAALEKQAPETAGLWIAAIDAFLMDQALGRELAELDPRGLAPTRLTELGKTLMYGSFSSGSGAFVGSVSFGVWAKGAFGQLFGVGAASSGVGISLRQRVSADALASGSVAPYERVSPQTSEQKVKEAVAEFAPAIEDLFRMPAERRPIFERALVGAILEQARQGAREVRFDVVRFMETEGFVEKTRVDAFERLTKEITDAKLPESSLDEAEGLRSAYAAQLPLLKQVRARLREVIRDAGARPAAGKSSGLARLRELEAAVTDSIRKIELNLKML